jgi:hypothetical protein
MASGRSSRQIRATAGMSSSRKARIGSELNRGSDSALDERVRKARGELVNGLPAGAVRGTSSDGDSSEKAWTVGPMIGSNIGPLR